MTTAIVCGGRYYEPSKEALVWLSYYHGFYTVDKLLSGCCRGADQAVVKYLDGVGNVHGRPAYFSQLEWARQAYEDGLLAGYTFPAALAKVGKRVAGAMRNAMMAKEAGEDGILFAFPGGVGTASMKRQARKVGMRVFEWDEECGYWEKEE